MRFSEQYTSLELEPLFILTKNLNEHDNEEKKSWIGTKWPSPSVQGFLRSVEQSVESLTWAVGDKPSSHALCVSPASSLNHDDRSLGDDQQKL